MRFKMRVIKVNPDGKGGVVKTEWVVEGSPRPDSTITVEDVRKTIEVEQFLERMLGVRVHIIEVTDEEGK